MCKRGCASDLSDMKVNKTSCEVCSISKATKLPHRDTRPRSLKFLENVHVDLSGIIREKGLNREMYYILFCDDYSSYRHIFPLNDKTKESVFDVFKFYIALSERQTGRKLIKFTLDRGSEFVNTLLGDLLRHLGITLHLTAPHTPEQNGVSERGNRTVVTKARSLMLEAGMPIRFWYEACKTAVFLTNRTVSSSLSDHKTPYEVWFSRKPMLKHLRVWGCLTYIHTRKELRDSKFSAVASEGVLMGFEDDNFNYHVYE